MKLCTVFLLALSLLAITPLAAFAQSADISGTVTDSTGASIAGVSVRVEPISGGVSRSTKSNDSGTYVVQPLEGADYNVRVSREGFTTLEKKVSVLVGQSITVDFKMSVASANTSVEVVASQIEISSTSSEVAGNVDPVQMQQVPLNGRNWMELVLLVPGVSRNDVGITNGPTIGADGGNFQINLDGQQTTQNLANSDYGQPRYVRDSLSQYQLITNRFDATQGRSTQMQINAQTRSGTDSMHGSAYGYFRDASMNASDFVAHKVLPYSDQQIGGTIGGAIYKDKLFYFGGFEYERTPQTIYLTPTDFGGQTFTLPSTYRSNSMSERIDFQQSEKSRFFLRATGFTGDTPVAGLTGTMHPSRGYASAVKNLDAVGDWNYSLSDNKVNDLHIGFGYFNYSNEPLIHSIEFRFANPVGAPYNYPGLRFQNVWSARDDFFWTHGKHSIKMGAELLNVWSHGIFQQSFAGTVTAVKSTPSNMSSLFPVWNDPSTWDYTDLANLVSTYVQGFGNDSLSIYNNEMGFWFQDDWHALPRLTLNLGVRYDDALGMMGNSLHLKSGLATPHSGDNNNIAPRLGFAYDVFGNHNTIVRGGGGIFYADVEANPYYDAQLFNGQSSIQASVKNTGAFTFSKPFAPYTGTDFLDGNATPPSQAIQLIQPGAQVPWSAQVSAGVAQQLSSKWTASADYVHYRVHHNWIKYDQNEVFNPATGYPQTTGTATTSANPAFTTITRYDSPQWISAYDDALLVSIRRAYTNGFTVAASYTLARLKDDGESFSYALNNQFNAKDEWGPGVGDQRHTFNVNGLYQMRWGFQAGGLLHFGSGAATYVAAGSSPFYNSPYSNRTYLATVKTYNNPKFDYASSAPGYNLVARDSLYGQPVYRFDIQLQKTFSFAHGRYRIIPIAQMFNTTNHPNYGSYANDITQSTYGKPAASTDLAYAPREGQLAIRFEF